MRRLMTNSITLALILVATDFGICCYKKVLAGTKYEPNKLIESRGKVQLKRPQWSKYFSVSVGKDLFPRDILRVGAGATAKVRCASGRLWRVPQGEWGLDNYCPRVPTNIIGIDLRPGGYSLALPFVISPRNTKLLNNRPKLRWNARPNVTTYTVSLEDQRVGKGIVWKIDELSSTEFTYPNQPAGKSALKYIEIDYPTNKPPLEPGVDYLLIVESQKRVKATDSCPSNDWKKLPNNPFLCITSSTYEKNVLGLGFSLLNESKAQQVRQTAAKLKQELNGEAEAIALAQLYSDNENNLLSKAINVLEALVEQGSQSFGVYSILGDFYQQAQLSRLAEARYIKAIELAEGSNDLEGQAIAQLALAEIFAGRGFWDGAIKWGIAAKTKYEALGDKERLKELESKLKEWGTP